MAFFRDMNLGQARTRSPTSAALLAAFADAGAPGARNVRTNGTVLFASSRPREVTGEVLGRLAEGTGYHGDVVVRTGTWVLELAQRLDPDLPGGEVALFDGGRRPRWELPWVEPERGQLVVVAIDDQHAVTSWRSATSGSNGATVLGRLLGVPVTCRGVRTMITVARRLQALAGT